MKKINHNTQMASDVLIGMAAGAAVSAAGMYLASHNQKEMKKMGKKLAHTAEQTINGVDKAIMNITRNF